MAELSKRDQTKASVAAFLAKHAGPGPHPSGSPQAAHGGKTRFQVQDESGNVLSTHTHWGDARDAKRKITGSPFQTRTGPRLKIVRTGSPEFTSTTFEDQISHRPLPPKV